MIDDYFEVLFAQLKGSAKLADKTHDSLRLDPDGGLIQDNYVVLFTPTMGDLSGLSVTKEPDLSADIPFEVEVRVVGTSVATARKMLSVATGRFIGFRVTADGRQPVMLRCTGTTPVRPDTDVKPFLYWASAFFSWTSRKA